MHAQPIKVKTFALKPLICGALLFAISAPASAQFAHFFKDAALTPEDIEIVSETAAALYTKPGVQPGDQLDWNNADTGAEGRVEVLEVSDAGKCVVLRHLAKTTKKPQIRYYVRRCLDANGNWILSAN